MIKELSRSRRFMLGLAFSCFIVQGIANGMLGVAWPSIRIAFGPPLDSLIILLACSTVGYILGSVMGGQIMGRVGIGRLLMVAVLLAALGYIGYSIAPRWWILILFGALTAWTNAVISVSLNIFVAATRTVRIMNWMHAMFGVGAMMGPLVMTAAIGSGLGWRLGYAFAALSYLLLGILFLTVLNEMNFKGVAHSSTPSTAKRSPAATLRLPIVILSILLFLLYTGVETTTGQWSYSLFTEERSMSVYAAGLSTSVFWGMLTLGRIVFGAAADRIGITRLLRWSMAGVVVSAGLLLIRTPAAGFIALASMGLSLAAIFPTLLSDTANRVGPEHTANAIGIQSGAASLGIAVLPGVAGVLAARLGLEVIGPYLVVASILMLMTNEVAIRLARRNLLRANLVPTT